MPKAKDKENRRASTGKKRPQKPKPASKAARAHIVDGNDPSQAHNSEDEGGNPLQVKRSKGKKAKNTIDQHDDDGGSGEGDGLTSDREEDLREKLDTMKGVQYF